MLRDYQVEMIGRLDRAWALCRSVMVQMPAGTGKTVLLAEVIHRWQKPSVLIVAHRRELIEQIKAALVRTGVDEGRVTVESIQKLSMTPPAQSPSLVIVDEAHHAVAKTYRRLWEWWPEAKFLGLTATPCRLSGEPFTGLFDVLLQSWCIQDFIDKGWLSDFEYVSASVQSWMRLQVRALKKRGVDGDYQEKEAAMVLDVPKSIEHLYETYRTFARGKKGIVYAINRAHASHIAAYYSERGVRCAVIDSKTPARERSGLVAAYRQQALDVLVNVDIFGEGFDVPEVEFIQLARPTLSLCKYLQQVGRGMRTSEGKDHVVILDNVGLYLSFGMPTDDRDWKAFFLGQSAGKAQPGGQQEQQLMERTVREKELVNLEMVRVKLRGERKSGLEIFEENGKYGVKKDGRVTCIAKFTDIELLGQDSNYFAIASFVPPVDCQTIWKTVIDYSGNDTKAQMYGDVKELGNGFFQHYEPYTSDYNTVFDVKSGQCFNRVPPVERIGAIEAFPYAAREYRPRVRGKEYKEFHFRKEDVLYDQYLTIIRYVLIVNSHPNDAYRIYGYRGRQIIIQIEKAPTPVYRLVNRDGTFGRKMTHLDSKCRQKVLVGELFFKKNNLRIKKVAIK